MTLKMQWSVFVLVLLTWWCEVGLSANLSRLTLRNGMVFEGRFSSIGEIAKNLTVRNPTAGGVAVKNIVIVDDNLRRTFFPRRNLAFS